MWRKLISCTLVIAALFGVVGLALVITWDVYWRVPGQLDFTLHRAWLEGAVRAAKGHRPPPVGQEGHLTIDRIRVDYVRRAANKYAITLETANWGNFGKAGYLYSDLTPVRTTGDPYYTVDAPGDDWVLEGQVAPHWWIISNHLQ